MDVGKLLEKASDQVSVRRAFGPAYERDGLLIIPVAIVAGGGGGGTGRHRHANPAASPASPPKPPPASMDAVSVASAPSGGLPARAARLLRPGRAWPPPPPPATIATGMMSRPSLS